jgi:hypothetical protein
VDYYADIEKEGWLHGRKVLDEEGEDGVEETESAGNIPPKRKSDGGDTTPTGTGGVCPFTGLTADMKGLQLAE